jgi:hypothetical protein
MCGNLFYYFLWKLLGTKFPHTPSKTLHLAYIKTSGFLCGAEQFLGREFERTLFFVKKGSFRFLIFLKLHGGTF